MEQIGEQHYAEGGGRPHNYIVAENISLRLAKLICFLSIDCNHES
jgi:hypothetical protein